VAVVRLRGRHRASGRAGRAESAFLTCQNGLPSSSWRAAVRGTPFRL
jgi:hypothetical protein